MLHGYPAPVCHAVPVLIATAACALAAAAWAYLLTGRGGYWRTDQRLPGADPSPGRPDRDAGPGRPDRDAGARRWPGVVAVVPARNEAVVLPAALPTLLGQDYPGAFTVVLVDDDSSDGTAAIAAALGRAADGRAVGGRAVDDNAVDDNAADGRAAGGRAVDDNAVNDRAAGREDQAALPGGRLRIVAGTRTPAGWAGKVWAMAQGLRAAGDAEYVLFTDADIAYRPDTLAALVRAAEADDRVLVSQMALLRADTGWERLLVPAFVYFFAQLYPFRLINRPGARTAAAAGGCMLIRRRELAAAGGLERIRGALIDDVALGQLMQSARPAARCWLGLSTDITSIRPYPRLADLWQMVTRSAYTQLRYSPAALAGTLAGLLWLYLLPPAAVLAGLAGLAAGGGAASGWLAVAGAAGWAAMSATYLPMLRLYGLSPLRAPSLPLIAILYAAMTADSARRHYRGRGGEWKGRPHGPHGALASLDR
jgi:hopene-associated glycosyltransferase HpnB